eukprot:scaffold133842_cov27-Prasinocladus_malaysianus.AAC.1
MKLFWKSAGRRHFDNRDNRSSCRALNFKSLPAMMLTALRIATMQLSGTYHLLRLLASNASLRVSIGAVYSVPRRSLTSRTRSTAPT